MEILLLQLYAPFYWWVRKSTRGRLFTKQINNSCKCDNKTRIPLLASWKLIVLRNSILSLANSNSYWWLQYFIFNSFTVTRILLQDQTCFKRSQHVRWCKWVQKVNGRKPTLMVKIRCEQTLKILLSSLIFLL